jgi:hypothetical protein
MGHALAHRAAGDLFGADEPQAGVEQKHAKGFLSQRHEFFSEGVKNSFGRVEQWRNGFSPGESVANLECGRHFQRFCGADSFAEPADFLWSASRQFRETATVAQEVAGDLEGVFSWHSGADEDRQQLGIGESLTPVPLRFLTRPLVVRDFLQAG